MDKYKETILKLRDLIELRRNTVIANKKAMKDYLVEYKKSLELDKELKREIMSLNEAINLLQYGVESEKEESLSENIASNRNDIIYTDNEE
tara:strand:- start:263 stop:535 length:273 start_codon:yes stop_codon:yes gene_type:complete